MKAYLNFTTKYIVNPFLNGVLGFAAFLFVLVATKYLSYLIGNQSKFLIEGEDLMLSLIGFVVFFLIRLLENYSEQHDQIR